jgi:hypothetical protein
MVLAGIVIAVAGWVLAVASVAISQSNGVRLVIVLAGIGVSLFGILGVLNQHYLKHALWKK